METSPDPILERLYGLHPKLIDLSLDRVFRLLGRLGDPHVSLPPVVHVAGTNAKGSVIAMMRAALQAADYKVHVHTSPHLVRFNERIRLAGDLIGDAALIELLEECEAANAGDAITFFEITTVAALLAFSRTPADIVLLETGLGGRLDATNVIDAPALTVITPVSMDHQQFLGDTLAAIATEKAGILKPGVRCVVAEQHPDVLAVIEQKADAIGAPLTLDHRDAPPTNLAGPHQGRNAAVAKAALDALAGFTVSANAITTGFANVDWPARLQPLTSGALADMLGAEQELWLDGGHNQAAGIAIAGWLESGPDKPLHVVMGMLNSKDPVAFLTPFKGRISTFRAVAIPGEENSFSADGLAARTDHAGKTSTSVTDALSAIATEHPGPGRVLITGSLYLAGKVLAENG